MTVYRVYFRTPFLWVFLGYHPFWRYHNTTSIKDHALLFAEEHKKVFPGIITKIEKETFKL